MDLHWWGFKGVVEDREGVGLTGVVEVVVAKGVLGVGVGMDGDTVVGGVTGVMA